MNRPKPQLKPNAVSAEVSAVSQAKALVVVWVSSESTQFYQQEFANSFGGSSISSGIDRIPGSTLGSYFEEIQRRLTPFAKVVILGPDMTKFHFRTYLQEQVPGLFRKIRGFETAGKLSSALGGAYLQKYGSQE